MNLAIKNLVGLSAGIALSIGSFGAYAEDSSQQAPLNINQDQIKGRVNETQGKAKELTGKVLDDKSMEVKGNVQKNVGKGQAGFGDLKKDIKDSQ